MTEKTVNIVVSIVLATTPLYENVVRRWSFYYLVRYSMFQSLRHTERCVDRSVRRDHWVDYGLGERANGIRQRKCVFTVST